MCVDPRVGWGEVGKVGWGGERWGGEGLQPPFWIDNECSQVDCTLLSVFNDFLPRFKNDDYLMLSLNNFINRYYLYYI